MKKIYFMLLMVCTICAFSACSDDDDVTPRNPITDSRMPQELTVGEEFTITGKGFTANSKLYLKNTEGKLTALTVKSASETEIVVTLPATLTAGTYKVVIQQDGEWEIGTIMIISPNPITGYAVPAKVIKGNVLEITGVGFADNCSVYLKPVLGDPIDMGTVTKVEGGIAVTVPEDIKEGVYTVVVKQDGNWELGTTEVMAEIRVVIEKKSMERIWVDGVLEEETPGYSQTTTLTYDTEGKVTAIRKVGDNSEENWKITYTDDAVIIAISGSEDEEPIENTITFTLDKGRVTHSADELNEREYSWNYDKAGFLLSVTDDNAADQVLANVANYEYAGSDLSNGKYPGLSAVFNYATEAEVNNPAGVDLFACITEVIEFPDVTLTARLLGICGKYPVHLPESLESPEWGVCNITYTKADGKVSSIVLLNREEDEEEGEVVALEIEMTYTIK